MLTQNCTKHAYRNNLQYVGSSVLTFIFSFSIPKRRSKINAMPSNTRTTSCQCLELPANHSLLNWSHRHVFCQSQAPRRFIYPLPAQYFLPLHIASCCSPPALPWSDSGPGLCPMTRSSGHYKAPLPEKIGTPVWCHDGLLQVLLSIQVNNTASLSILCSISKNIFQALLELL